jgi:hypothetical protein
MTFTSELNQIADAVRAELAAQEFIGQAAPELSHRPSADLVDTVNMLIFVVPAGYSNVGVATRKTCWYDNDIDVILLKKMTLVAGKFVPAEVDAIMFIEQELETFFRLRQLVDYPRAKWWRAGWYSPDVPGGKVDAWMHTYKSAMRLTYRTLR